MKEIENRDKAFFDYNKETAKKSKAKETPFFSKNGMIILGILLILLAVFMTSQDIMSDDFYWHISVGEWIVAHKEIPTTGIFSWTASDTPWFAHEWLAEIVMYGFSLLGVEFGGWLYFVISITLMFALIYFMNIKNINKNYIVGIIAWISLIFSTQMVSSARPHILSMSFFIYLLYSLEQFKANEQSKWIYFTPLVTLIWANYHGGTIMFIPILFLIYILSGLFNFNFMKMAGRKLSKKQLITLLILFVVNMITVCVNPHGIELITYPFSYSNTATKYVGEWQSPSFSRYPQVIIVIIAICIVLFLTQKKLNFTDLGVLGTLMLMTLVYVRFIWWLSVVMIFILLKYIPHFGHKGYKNIIVSSLLLMLVAVVYCIIPFYNVGLIDQPLSPEALQVIQDSGYVNMYNTYDMGNTLIYHGHEVFLDGRSDMYQHVISKDIYQKETDENYDADKTITVLEEGMEFEGYNLENMDAFVEKYNLDLFVIFQNSRCKFYLETREDIEKIFEDDNVLIYQKTKQ